MLRTAIVVASETSGKVAALLRPRSRRRRSHRAAPIVSNTASPAHNWLGSWSEERTREKEGRKEGRKKIERGAKLQICRGSKAIQFKSVYCSSLIVSYNDSGNKDIEEERY